LTPAGNSRSTFAGVANPTGDLPFTETEIALASSYFTPESRSVLSGADASVDRVLTAIRGKRYLHFASHGFYAWDAPDRSSLLLTGRQHLSVARLQQFGGLGRPRLVVLSACETGIYELNRTPEEFVGLPGALISIGALGVISTLWQVDDRATALLIGKFYDLHIGARLPPATALSRVQGWLRTATKPQLIAFARRAANRQGVSAAQFNALADTFTRSVTQVRFGILLPGSNVPEKATLSEDPSSPFAHPYYWAAFVLTGL